VLEPDVRAGSSQRQFQRLVEIDAALIRQEGDAKHRW
jgi:hypothetical protein